MLLLQWICNIKREFKGNSGGHRYSHICKCGGLADEGQNLLKLHKKCPSLR